MRAAGVLLVLAAWASAGEVSLVFHRGGVPMPQLIVVVGGQRAVTDAEGIARWARLPVGRHKVEIRFPAAGPGRFGGTMAAGEIEVKGVLIGKRMQVPSPVTLTGRVIDGSTGLPLAAAPVEVSTPARQKIATLLTDERGRFRLAGLASAVARIRVRKQGYSTEETWLRIRSDWPVELFPRPEGQPAMAAVAIRALRGAAPAGELEVELTLASGAVVTLAGPPRGIVRVPLRYKGEAIERMVVRDATGWSAPVAVRAGLQQVFLRGLTVRGRVVGAKRQPVAGVAVSASKGERARTVWADQEGRFVLEGLDRGPWTFEVIDRQLRTPQPVVVKVTETTPPVELRAQPVVTLSGRVSGLGDGVRATVQSGPMRTTTDQQGRFTIRGMPARNQYWIQVSAPGYIPHARIVSAQEPIEIAIARAAAITGVVLDEQGQPLSGARVLAGDRRGGIPMRSATTDDEGRYRIENLSVGGRLRIRVMAEGYAPAVSAEIVVERKPAERAPMRLQRGVELTGFVRDEKGNPVAGVLLTAGVGNPFGRGGAPSDEQGIFRLSNLAPGRVTITISPRGSPDWEAVVEPLVLEAPARDVVFSVRRRVLADLDSGDGIAWAQGVKATLARARRDNLPVLVAINALDNETGNKTMAFLRYRNPKLVETTRSLLCLIASPSDHGDQKNCSRFGSCTCADHKQVLNWALARFGRDGNLISPQHMILAPDGEVLFRQEFWIEVADLRRAIEKAIVKVTPRRALMLARQSRSGILERLRAGADPVAYVQSRDPLAAAVLLLLYDDDGKGRWLEALKAAPKESFGLVRILLEDDQRLVPVAKAIDGPRGEWWERYHAKAPEADPPPPRDEKLADAWKRFRAGDKSALPLLLAALGHPVDGPEVRACLAHQAGRDLGADPTAWKEHFSR